LLTLFSPTFFLFLIKENYLTLHMDKSHTSILSIIFGQYYTTPHKTISSKQHFH
jgi:hypothetical protein